jgi:hypothetical protein
LPRRQIYSAAGALAAALLAAITAPAVAQDATGTGQALRGSITPQQDTQPTVPPVPTGNKQRQTTSEGLDSSVAGGEGAASVPLSGEGYNASLLPPPPAPPPPLGGLGDVSTEPPPAVPGIGITTATGETGLQPPGTEEISDERPLPPERHDLDPYVPIGMPLGSFLLFSEAEVGALLNNNVLGTRLDPQFAEAFEFAPNVRLQSNWSRHFFSAEFDADRTWYNRYSVQNDKTYVALLKGRLDVTHRNHADLELGKSLTQEGRNSISLTDIAGNQTNVAEQHITAGADHTFNRLTLKATGTVADYDYSDLSGPFFDVVTPTVQTPIPTRDIRDYREDELKLRGDYELKSQTSAFVEGSINQYTYKQPVSAEGLLRGSSGFTIESGLNFAPTDKLTGEVGVGWGQQQSVDERLGPIQGMLLDADVLWRPDPITLVEFLARSEVEPTTLVDSLGAIDHFCELSLQHAFWNYLVVGGHVSYEIADYADNPLTDQRVKSGASAEYYLNPYASVYARYEHTDFFSTDKASDFLEDEFRVGMRIRH